LRREGRRKRKAGAKNEKAIVLYQQNFRNVKGKITQISKENSFFYEKFLIRAAENRGRAVFASGLEEYSVAIQEPQ
jgi:hypothetical protein